ncbi:hypothetical protein Ahy_A10g049953 [Arachis hypogaea]|uniref:Protein FAR1-RELATED SEQUENCE n=1 Tax=Arachis hypogaea TaxID=3818 RepID=A0A445B8B1_ARAHY|nr:hypothetical protein Ahy_A10g049953 [Arachis hypogaea]
MTTCLRSIERHATTVYTREVFGDVKKEIEGVGALNQINKRRILNTMVYTLEEYEEPNVHIMASFGRSTSKVSCQCNFWKKHGYPCKDMFFVMKAEHLKEIPDKLVLRRWKTDAKSPEHPYVKTLSWITRHFIVGLSRALNMPVNQMLWLGTHLLLSQKELQNLERKKALVCTCCKGTGHTKRTYLAKGDYDEQHDLRDDAFEGDDLDMPDRDDEHVGDNLFLGPRGTSNNVYHNTVSCFLYCRHEFSTKKQLIAKTGAHATYQQASVTREAVSWVDKLGVP